MISIEPVVSLLVDTCTLPRPLPACVGKVKEHTPGGVTVCNSLRPHVTPEQEAGKEVNCDAVRLAVKEMNPAGICELMHLFHHQKFIPEDWKQYRGVGFSATVVEDTQGVECILSLCWSPGGKWYIGVRPLSRAFSKRHPVALVGTKGY